MSQELECRKLELEDLRREKVIRHSKKRVASHSILLTFNIFIFYFQELLEIKLEKMSVQLERTQVKVCLRCVIFNVVLPSFVQYCSSFPEI